MTQFVGHGQPIIHVFETAIILNMVKSQFFSTLLVPISWALAIRLGTILGRFSIIYFRGLGLRIRVWVMVWVGVRVSVVLWSG